jgi:hypothetical protein
MPIFQIIERIQLRRKRRLAIHRATRELEPAAIAQLIEEYPGQAAIIEEHTLRDYEAGSVGDSLLLCLGLMMADSPNALTVLRKLISSKTWQGREVPWNRLKDEQIASVTEYLSAHSAFDEFEQFLSNIGENQFQSIKLDCRHPAFLHFLEILLKTGKPLHRVTEELMQAVMQASILHDSVAPENQLLPCCYQASELILSSGRTEEALGSLATLVLAGVPIEERILKRVADALPNLSDDAITRAAGIFKHLPSARWVPVLKDAWLTIEDDVRFDPEQPMYDHVDPAMDAVANAVAIALGACAACDGGYRDFDEDLKLTEEKPEAADKYNRMVEEYNRLAQRYTKQALSRDERESIEEKLKDLRPRIEDQRDDLESQYHGHLSPGYLLLGVLKNAHIYPTSVRQGAAWGLHILTTRGHLDEEAKAMIFDAIRESVQGNENRGFSERSIRLLPGRGVLELSDTLLDGLKWMHDLIEGDYATGLSDDTPDIFELTEHLFGPAIPLPRRESDFPPVETADEYPRLNDIVSLMCEVMPGAMDFLVHHPLRLMPLDYHKRVLGEYSSQSCHLTLWTRYTPPKDTGTVHRRYLTAADRSTPNSMGIYYRLFRHPALVLPVIYHEFMHYGGPAGNPRQGIENETEVLLRELIFARFLIARLAPRNDEELPLFEDELIEEIRHSELHSLQWQLGYDFWNNDILAHINEQVINVYGDRLSDDEAERKPLLLIASDNRWIELQNHLETWANHISWPLLGSSQSVEVTKRYKQTLKRQWNRQHRVAPAKRDQVLRQEPCSTQIREWNSYCGRRHALQRLLLTSNSELDLIEILRLIIHRFEL